ncbi:uncharacterized protein LOC119676817 [Teleopsis dalmanni]|uniref:uncharacterized protein LOC119676817 n=1 Tax=Teleopsis dalmanni TaxID=139649 RepID=UPI0018CE8B21|nr:uncharacterized protein LOC119676817 [Teleopsis dalmanni]
MSNTNFTSQNIDIGEKPTVNQPTSVAPDETTSDTETAASVFDPSVYAGLVPPEIFQQYLNQFGGAYVPYPVAAAAYPAPMGYVPPPPPPGYPNPYVVQTGYEGFLVPTTDVSENTNNNDGTESVLSLVLNPLSMLGNIFSTTVFRVIAAVLSTIVMIFFSTAIRNFICTFTPFCDAANALKRSGTAEVVGRMIADEMTPERIRRTTEFVRNALRKYQAMQKLSDQKED